MRTWPSYSIGDVAEVFDGPHATPKKIDEGPWFLSISSLQGGRLVLAESAHVSEEDYSRWTRRVTPQPGDVLFSYETRLGEAAIMPEGVRACLGRRMGLLRPNRDLVDPKFLLLTYLSPGFQRTIQERKIHGATVDRIPLVDLPRWPIRLPSIGEQRAIAAVLQALDDKIAVNEQVSITAELLGGTLFEEQFGPALRHLTNGAPLPDNWRLATLGQTTVTLESGTRPRGGVAKYASGVPSIGAESIIGLARFDYSKAKFVPNEYFASMRRGVLRDHDILIYKDGGKPGDFKPHISMFGNGFPFDQMCINEHVYRVRMTSRLGQAFGYYWMSSAPIMSEMRRRGTGAAIPGINSTAVKGIPVVEPSVDAVTRFNDTASPLIERALQAAAESRTLGVLHDTLLPQLMASQLCVREAERIIEDAV